MAASADWLTGEQPSSGGYTAWLKGVIFTCYGRQVVEYVRKSKMGPEIILGAWIMIIRGIGTYVGLDQDGKKFRDTDTLFQMQHF